MTAFEESSACAGDSVGPVRDVELQDHMLAVSNDLERLQHLLNDACETLMEGFLGVTHQLQSLQVIKPANSAAIEQAVKHLASTARALQFHDMSTQLLAHSSQRIRHCASVLARDAFTDDDGDAMVEPAPFRPNPVTQSEVDTGFVELF